MIKTPWRLAARLLARDWRSGEVLVLLAALVVAVAAMSAVTFFTDRVRSAVSQQAGEALAADLRVESINPLPDEMRAAATRHGLATADIVSFRSVVAAGDMTSLADVRGVTASYPLRGVVQVADRLAGVPQNATGIPARGEVWAEPSLMARLGAAVGDELEVGQLRLRVARTLEFRPDEGWRFMEIAPTVAAQLRRRAGVGFAGARQHRRVRGPLRRRARRSWKRFAPTSCRSCGRRTMSRIFATDGPRSARPWPTPSGFSCSPRSSACCSAAWPLRWPRGASWRGGSMPLRS